MQATLCIIFLSLHFLCRVYIPFHFSVSALCLLRFRVTVVVARFRGTFIALTYALLLLRFRTTLVVFMRCVCCVYVLSLELCCKRKKLLHNV